MRIKLMRGGDGNLDTTTVPATTSVNNVWRERDNGVNMLLSTMSGGFRFRRVYGNFMEK